MTKFRLIGHLCLALFLYGCAGRDARPVAVMQIGDTELTCQEIADELSTLDVEARRKFSK